MVYLPSISTWTANKGGHSPSELIKTTTMKFLGAALLWLMVIQLGNSINEGLYREFCPILYIRHVSGLPINYNIYL